jgi:tape measure domain-containing protein
LTRVAKIAVELNLDDGSFTGRMEDAADAVNRFQRNVNSTAASVERIERRITGLGTAMRDLVLTISHIRGAFYTLYGVTGGWISQIVQAKAEMERMTVMMSTFSDQSDALARDMEGKDIVDSIRGMAKEMPIAFDALTDAAVKFKAGGLDPMDGSLRALGDSVSAFGGTSEVFHRAAIAIQQMAGKGVVSMEELRQQLGEAVPTAINLMARSMGLTVSELVKKVSTGSVEATSALTKMFDEMKRTYGGDGARLMETFNGQVALFRTNMKELLTTNAGIENFFTQMKLGMQELNALFSDPIVQKFVTDLGNGLAYITEQVREAIPAILNYRHEIFQVGAVLAGVFVGRTLINGIRAIGLAIAGAVTPMRTLGSVTAAFSMGVARVTTDMATASAGMRTAAVASGVLAGGLRLVGSAISFALGPAGIAIGILMALTDVFGLMGGKAKQAGEDIENGLITDRAVQEVKKRREEIQAELEELRTGNSLWNQGEAYWERNDWSEYGKEQLAAVRAQIAELEKELLGLDKLASDGERALLERAADRLIRSTNATINEGLKNVRVSYNLAIEQLQKDREQVDENDVEARKALNEQQIAIMKAHFAAETALRARAIEQARTMMESADTMTAKAGRELFLQLKEDQEQSVREQQRMIEVFQQENVIWNQGQAEGKELLEKIEQRMTSLTQKAVRLREELAGQTTEVAKVNALIASAEELNLISPDEAKALREAAAEVDRLTQTLKDQKEMEKTVSSLTEKFEDLSREAQVVWRAVATGMSDGDPGGLIKLRDELTKILMTAKGTPEELENLRKQIEAIMRVAADVEVGNIAQQLVDETQQINVELIKDDRERLEKQLEMEAAAWRMRIAMTVENASKRAEIEAAFDDWLLARKAKLEADLANLASKGAGSNPIEERFKRMRMQIAEVQDELRGATGAVAEINRLLEHDAEFKGASPEQRERLRNMATELDRLNDELERYEDAKDALKDIEQAAADAGLEMARLRAILAFGEARGDVAGLAAEFDELDRNLKLTAANADLNAKALEANSRARQSLANKRLLELGIDWRDQARQINLDLIEDDRERIRAQLALEEERVRQMVDVLVKEGADRKEVEADVQAYIAAIRAKADRDMEGSIKRLFREWKNTAKAMEDAGADWLNGLVDGIVEFAKTGKFEFSKFAESVLADILRIQSQAAIAKAGSGVLDSIGGWIGDALGGLFDTGGGGTTATAKVGKNHLGGIVGREVSGTMTVPASLFDNARRYHEGGIAGLRTDEVPTILKRDEGVFTPEQMRALGLMARGPQQSGPVEVNIINQSGVQMDARTQQRIDARGMILDVVLQAASTPGGFREGLKGALAT